MIKSIRHKGLKDYWAHGSQKGLDANKIAKISRLLDQLHVITAPENMNYPGTGFHQLSGNRQGQYALKVTKNWRMVFEWDGHDVINIDLIDYH